MYDEMTLTDKERLYLDYTRRKLREVRQGETWKSAVFTAYKALMRGFRGDVSAETASEVVAQAVLMADVFAWYVNAAREVDGLMSPAKEFLAVVDDSLYEEEFEEFTGYAPRVEG